MAYDVNIVGHINDDIMNTLLGLGFTEGHIDDRMFAHLGSLGHTGHINDRFLQAGGKKQYIEDLLGGSAVSNTLTAAYIDLSAVEIWEGDDASDGMAALNTASHDLGVTGGTDIGYEYEFPDFPGQKGLDLTGSSDNAYLTSGGDVSDLVLQGDWSMIFIVSGSEPFVGAQLTGSYVGMAVPNDATINTNNPYASGIPFNDPAGVLGLRYSHQYGTNNLYNDESTNMINKIREDSAYLYLVTRNGTTRTISYYVNGEFIDTDTYGATQVPTGGSLTNFIIGRDTRILAVNDRMPVRIGQVAVFDSELSASDAKTLMSKAVDALGRAGEEFTNFVTLASTDNAETVSTAQELTICQHPTNTTVTVDLSGLSDGESCYAAQWDATGTVTGALVSGSLTGTTVTSNQGDILKITRTDASNATATVI